MFTEDVDSYFPPQPIIQPLPSSDTSSPALHDDFALLQKPGSRHHRPPTPPFPPSHTPQPGHKSTNDSHTHKHESRSKPSHPAYSRFLGRLHDEHERDDRRSHSRSRSGSSSSSTLPAILRLLAHETARADAAERDLARDSGVLLTRVRDVKVAKDRSDSELARVKEELSLYKLQLDVAQKEINRAQIIVADVERARVEAEDRGTRDRDRIRKLITERAVEIAREEGRREGWKQGLESGRWAAWSSLEGGLRTMAHEARETTRRIHSSQSSSSSHSRTRSSSSTSRTDMHELGRNQSRNPVHQPALPAPIPIRPNSRRAHQGPVHNSAPASAFIHPEDISVHARPGSRPRSQSRTSGPRVSSPTQTQYSYSRARSPSIARSHRSHRSVVLPPDGYIPTLGPDALITLPPPHELSQPVDFGPDEQTEPGDAVTEDGRGSLNQAAPEMEQQRAPRARDYAYRSGSALHSEEVPGYDEVFRARSRGGRTATAMSATSRGSTRISQYDLVSPPRDQERERDWVRRRNALHHRERSEQGRNTSGLNAPIERRGRTQPEQIVEEWRSANSDIVGTPTPSNLRDSKRTEHVGSTHPLNNEGTSIHGILMNSGVKNSPMMRSTDLNGRIYPPRENGAPHSVGSGLPGPSNYTRNIYQNVKFNSSGPSKHFATVSNDPLQNTLKVGGRSGDQNMGARRPGDGPQRSLSSTTVIGIAVEPPSRSPTDTSGGTVVDPILLTPDHANRPTPLPQNMALAPHEASSGVHSDPNYENNPVNIVWPDDKLPLGFVPLSPIPALTNFNPDDHDHHRMHEQFQGGGYQIYAGAAFVPPPPIVASGSPSGHRPQDVTQNSILFTGTQRAPTPQPEPRDPPQPEAPRRRITNFDSSPAPLNRPFSIFSDT